jgi:transposase
MVIGILSIDVSADGVMLGSLKNSMNISMMPVKSLRSSLIQRSFGLIHLQRVPLKKNDGQAGEVLGRSHSGFTTKLHAAVSDTFLPLRFILTAGARHDVTQAPVLIAGYTCDTVIADAAYDSDAFRAEIVDQGSVPVIRPRKNRLEDRPYDKDLYKLRNVIERFFHRLKQYRRVATRYDKYARRYLGFVYVAAILITAKKM